MSALTKHVARPRTGRHGRFGGIASHLALASAVFGLFLNSASAEEEHVHDASNTATVHMPVSFSRALAVAQLQFEMERIHFRNKNGVALEFDVVISEQTDAIAVEYRAQNSKARRGGRYIVSTKTWTTTHMEIFK